jgi:hypothetical protein
MSEWRKEIELEIFSSESRSPIDEILERLLAIFAPAKFAFQGGLPSQSTLRVTP